MIGLLLNFSLCLVCFLLCGCLDQSSSRQPSDSTTGNPTGYNSSLNATPQYQVSSNFKLVKLDGVTPIDGSENSILVCTPKLEYCVQTCISVYVQNEVRWSIFKTDYLNGQKCVAYALAYSDGQSIPRLKYWLGNYVYNSGQVIGRCVFNNTPNFDGLGYFDFIRPQNAQAYYIHSLFDLAGNLQGSIHLINFIPPGMWTYYDSSVTSADITPQLTNNFSCIKESEIPGAFQ